MISILNRPPRRLVLGLRDDSNQVFDPTTHKDREGAPNVWAKMSKSDKIAVFA